MALRTFPLHPVAAGARLGLLRSRGGWWVRFMDPRELFGFKVSLLIGCFFLAALIGP